MILEFRETRFKRLELPARPLRAFIEPLKQPRISTLDILQSAKLDVNSKRRKRQGSS